MKKLFFALLLIGSDLLAQDPMFTMGYSSSMHLNPALTGYQKGYKVNLNYRNQWPNISGSFVTSAVGIQKKIDLINAGVGLLLSSDNAGDGTIATLNIGLNLSKSFNLTDQLGISIGSSFNYQQKSVDWSKLTFSDMIDAKYGFMDTAAIDPYNTTVSYFTFTSGILFTYPLGNIGLVTSNINQPNQSFSEGGVSRLPMRFTFHATHDFHIIPGNILVISPSVIINTQQDFHSLTSGVTTRYKWFKVYTGYSVDNAVIAGGGLCFKYFNLNYIYETTVSKLSNATGGAHEVSMSLRFGKNKDYTERSINAF
jgi:type IX secretion system PorP/SprF family membrane protein